MEYTIQTYGLSKKYGGYSVVQNVSMHVPKGQIYGLLGRNGAGKTTIMKMVLGLVKKDSGSVTLFNQEMAGYQSGIYARIGSTIESPSFYSNLTATENLLVFSRLRGKVNENKICDALGVVGLPYQDKKIFSKYSLGMKQRLAIANAIKNDPELLILDEPTNGLDPIGIAEMRMLIRRLSHECGKTILISSHQLSEMEQMVDWIGIIHEGRMLEECSYQQLEENRHSYIRLIVKEPEQVYEYLKKTLSIENIKRPEASVIEIYDLKYGTLELNSRLFAAGLAVVEISKCQNSLEDYFKELTGGAGIA
ncbi:ABC transporter ATP-binding protein [Schaedlerella arabinosiphila]|nr:ABC transporter ATP-binding protein [Schaedlerella arabinosiphila]KAI4440325.1 Bacitracin transport ATP-binding protein BcrA [Schaedlerella arabinosiphila]